MRGGKGVNVASFLAHFGHDVTATGLLGADNRAIFDQLFSEKGIVNRMILLPGRTRVNVKILDHNQGTVTDINFPGLAVGPDSFKDARDVVLSLADEGSMHFVIAGSLPEAAPTTLYRDSHCRIEGEGRAGLSRYQW